MSEQQGRKRSPIEMPGEGTGVPGVDPLVCREPGDLPEVDELLVKLRVLVDKPPKGANSQDEEPETERKGRVKKSKSGQGAKERGATKRESEGTGEREGGKGGEARGSASRSEPRKSEPRNEQGNEQGNEASDEQAAKKAAEARKRRLNPQWLTFATVAIVMPAIVLLLVLVLSRTKAPKEEVRETTPPREMPQEPSAVPVMSTVPMTTAAPSTMPGPGARVIPSVTAAPSVMAAPDKAVKPKKKGMAKTPAEF